MKKHTPKFINGFTLIEVLTAVTIGALIIAGISATLHSVFLVEEGVGAKSKEDRTARIILSRMSREAVSVIRLKDSGVIYSTGAVQKDSIRFWTGAYDLPLIVEYEWRENSGKLFRRETNPLLLRESKWIPITGATGLGIRFSGQNGWQEEWTENGVPQAIAVELTVDRKKYGTIIKL